MQDQEALDGWIDETGTLESPMDAYGREVAARVVEQQELQNLHDEILVYMVFSRGRSQMG